jgi:putative transposase
MPNHVHIIILPSDEDGLRRTFADAHRRYTGYINARLRVTGHLWQGLSPKLPLMTSVMCLDYPYR